jgi:hypothetical protein
LQFLALGDLQQRGEQHRIATFAQDLIGIVSPDQVVERVDRFCSVGGVKQCLFVVCGRMMRFDGLRGRIHSPRIRITRNGDIE